VQGVLVGPTVKRLGERRTLLIGLAMGAIGFAVYAFATNGATFLVGVPIVGLCGLAGPAVQSLMSRLVTASEQGELQGAVGALFGITAMVGPGLFTQVFAASIGEHALAVSGRRVSRRGRPDFGRDGRRAARLARPRSRQEAVSRTGDARTRRTCRWRCVTVCSRPRDQL
jgi:MFS family permease